MVWFPLVSFVSRGKHAGGAGSTIETRCSQSNIPSYRALLACLPARAESTPAQPASPSHAQAKPVDLSPADSDCSIIALFHRSQAVLLSRQTRTCMVPSVECTFLHPINPRLYQQRTTSQLACQPEFGSWWVVAPSVACLYPAPLWNVVLGWGRVAGLSAWLHRSLACKIRQHSATRPASQPARQPASQPARSVEPASQPPSQPVSQPPSQPASQPAPPWSGLVWGSLPE